MKISGKYLHQEVTKMETVWPLFPSIQETLHIYKQILPDEPACAPTTTNAHALEQGSRYHIKRTFEIESEKRLRNVFKESFREAYEVFFKTHPNYANIQDVYKIIYCPSTRLPQTRYRFYLGVDAHLFGWNIIGQVLEDYYYSFPPFFTKEWVYMTHLCIQNLKSQLSSGEDVVQFVGKTPQEILVEMNRVEDIFENLQPLDDIFSKFNKGTLADLDLIHYEFYYPRNIALLVRKYMAPFINYQLDFTLHNRLYNSFFRLLEKNRDVVYHPQLCLDEMVKHRLGTLYAAEKLPLSDAVKTELDEIKTQWWSDKKVVEAISYLPNVSWGCSSVYDGEGEKMLVLSENNEPISPLFVSNLEWQEKKFMTVAHLAYFKMFVKLGCTDKDAYELIYQSGKGFLDFYACDVDYHIDSLLYNKARQVVYNTLKNKLNVDPDFERELVSTCSQKSITTQIPGDDFLSTTKNTNIYGDLLVRLREKARVSRKAAFDKWIFLLSLTTDKEELKFIERYYVHLYHSFQVAHEELGFERTKDALVLLLKMVYPSWYTLYKASSTPSTESTESKKPVFHEAIDDASNKFITRVFTAVLTFHRKAIEEPPVPKHLKKREDILKKICLLYYFAPLKSEKTMESIEKILTGKTKKWAESQIPFTQHYKDLFKKYKIRDETIQKKMATLSHCLVADSSYQCF